MEELSIMAVDGVTDRKMWIRCRFINEWCRVDCYTAGKEGLFLEIEKRRPDVVLFDIDLYAEKDGIETARVIRSQFGVPIYYI